MVNKRKILLNIGLALFSFAILVVSLEIVLRLAGFMYMTRQNVSNLLNTKSGDKITILCLGESTTSSAYPTRLVDTLKEKIPGVEFEVIDKGVPATTSSAIVENLDEYISLYKPDIIVSMMGINDKGEHIQYVNKPDLPWFKRLKVTKLFYLSINRVTSLLEKASSEPTPIQEEEKTREEHIKWFEKQTISKVPLEKLKLVGDAYFHKQQFEKAIKVYEAILSKDMKNAVSHFDLGNVYAHAQNHVGAIPYFIKALEIDPGYLEAEQNLAMSYQHASSWEESKATFEKIVEKYPNDAWSHMLFAMSFNLEGDLDNAEKYYKIAIELNPLESLPYQELGNVFRKQGRYEEEKALYLSVIDNPAIQNESLKRMMKQLLNTLHLETRESVVAEEPVIEEGNESAMYSAETKEAYDKLKEVSLEKGIKLFAMQYPVRSVEALKAMIDDDRVTYIDNEGIFKEKLEAVGYDALFFDSFAGDFGHSTHLANQLIADNIVETIKNEFT